MDHTQKAVENFLAGYNCAQSVFLAYQEEIGLDRSTMLRLSSSFGGGIGGLREVCGALNGAFLAAGYLYGYDGSGDQAAKSAHYRRVQGIARGFAEKNGSYICRELLNLRAGEKRDVPEARTEKYYAERPCARMVRDAAQLLDELLEKEAPLHGPLKP